MKRPFLGVLAAFILIVVLSGLIPTSPRVGGRDFRAYWSASYLLARSQNFSDPDLILALEQEQTGWSQSYPVMTWNPPWLLALLIPYTFVAFAPATWMWLFTNIILFFVASVWAWPAGGGDERGRRLARIAPLIAFAFSPTLVALIMGQVNSLVYFGLAAFLYWEARDRRFAAGAGLALTLVKPHLVYVTVPILLLRSLHKRQWRVFWGLGLALLGLTAVVFLLRPSFLADYGRITAGGNLLNWETPTLGGIVAATLGWQWSKWMGVVVLPLAILAWRRWRDWLDVGTLVNVTLLLSLITAPFGWGYDAVVLLLPLLSVIAWVVAGRFGRLESITMILALLVADGISFYMRTLTVNEVYYFWLPLVIAAVYTWARLRTVNSSFIVHNSSF